MKYDKIIDKKIDFGVQLQTLPTKGNLVYEYNPFRNYRLSSNMYEYLNLYFTKEELGELGITISEDNKSWNDVPAGESIPILREKGELVDFITDLLNFSLEHPVHITPQVSYDGSVNLILNDGYNVPRLINSRFSAIGKNEYEIVDRKGNNDTNIYDLGSQFDIDTSLYKRITKIPKIIYEGTTLGGNLLVGNYFFYFKLSDEDGNETDIVGESGLVSIFIGNDSAKSIHSGIKNENSYKNVIFKINNIDLSYNYVNIYYSRTTSDVNASAFTEYNKILKKFPVNNAGDCIAVITGFELTEICSAAELNLNYNVIGSAETTVECLNMLFMGNVKKSNIPYYELLDLSLRFLPKLDDSKSYSELGHNYKQDTRDTYYDSKFIYNYTGYWDNEFYRLGVVYIMPNNELSPVFNIRGGVFTDDNNEYTDIKVREDGKRKKILYNEETFYLTPEQGTDETESTKPVLYENVKGVVRFYSESNNINGIKISADSDVINELKKYVKGFFFVRQTRIPTVLAQGLVISTDPVSYTPCLPVNSNNFLHIFNDKYNYVPNIDPNKTCYISEGFLSRYKFNIKGLEGDTGNKMLKGAAVGLAIGVSVLGAVFTAGASLAASALIGTMVAGGIAGGSVAVEGITSVTYMAAKEPTANKKDTEATYGHKLVDSENSRILTKEILDRLIITDKGNPNAIICPDYELNLPYYNRIFTGDECLIESSKYQPTDLLLNASEDFRHYYFNLYGVSNNPIKEKVKITGVPDGTKIVLLDNLKFRSKAGEAEEAFLFEQVGEEYDSKNNSDIIRGNFGTYLATTNSNKELLNRIVNIYVPGYSELNISDYISIRMLDSTQFYAISERFDINNLNESSVSISDINNNSGFETTCYRGDCYICQFTHRLNRNFNDPSAPYNDLIVDKNTWKDNYDPEDKEKYLNINLGDVNAVPLGMWVTFKFRSSNNLNIRALDGSNVEEAAMVGHSRGFYPNTDISTEGVYKHPESNIYNKGFSKSVGDRWNFELPDVPALKNSFSTRIMYSDIHVSNAFKNGFRVFRGTNYRDYTKEYGSITKLISLESSLLCVFEHGVALIPVNERVLSGQGTGGDVFINTNNVLPENPKILSDTFGSLWADSVIKTDNFVYGIDTIAKKIWRTNGSNIECISDFKVQEFLNNNITLKERELTPILGIRNVKTFYNAFKKDVLFTFYDNTYGFEEKVWNLCWNEILEKFITFYSWVPSYMENIYNVPFSFDRNTSKYIAKLGISHEGSSFADGITLSNVIIGNKESSYLFKYLGKNGEILTTSINNIPENDNLIGILSLSNRIVPITNYQLEFKLEKDSYKNYLNFEIKEIKFQDKSYELPDNAMYPENVFPIYGLYLKESISDYKDNVIYLNIKAIINITDSNSDVTKEFYNKNKQSYENLSEAGYYESVVAITTPTKLKNLSTDFWKHGQGGIFDITEPVKPTNWYGKQHPFEFEFVVVNDPSIHKIFTNLEIISNNVKPESFHYEIIGDCYDFNKDKVNMFFRLEALKALWLNNGANITYDRNFLKLLPNLLNKSADLLKVYYARQDKINEVEDYYVRMLGPKGYDYRHLSGGELIYYPNRQEFRIVNHVEAVDVNNDIRSLISANCQYLEDKWRVHINPLLVTYKNEGKLWLELSSWNENKPPLPIYNSPIPNESLEHIQNNDGNVEFPDELRNLGYTSGDIDSNSWINGEFGNGSNRKELDLKDKFIKIKIRYSGEELAVIDFLNTIYHISYS